MITTVHPTPRAQAKRPRSLSALILPHRLDVHEVTAIHQEVRRLDLGRGDRIALDAGAVEHTDRAGLECLVDVQAYCDSVGATVHVTNMSLALRLGIEFTGTVGVPCEQPVDLLAQITKLAA